MYQEKGVIESYAEPSGRREKRDISNSKGRKCIRERRVGQKIARCKRRKRGNTLRDERERVPYHNRRVIHKRKRSM